MEKFEADTPARQGNEGTTMAEKPPIYPELTPSDQERVLSIISEV